MARHSTPAVLAPSSEPVPAAPEPTWWPRRRFVQAGAGALAAAAGAPHLRRFAPARPVVRRLGAPLPAPTRALLGDDPALTALAAQAVEAATAAGASYADARLTYVRQRQVGWVSGIRETELCHVGVRALVNGTWGFATHPYWVPAAAAWLGREAVHQATLAAGGPAGPVTLGRVPRISDGHWATPTTLDPFAMPLEESWDRFGGLIQHCRQYLLPSGQEAQWRIDARLDCWQEQMVWVSSEASRYTQTRTRTTPFLQVHYADNRRGIAADSTPAPFLTETGAGFEAAFDVPTVLAWVPRAVEECRMLAQLPTRPVEVGQYDMVWDAPTVADLLGGSLGHATQVDRILGYEANVTGTSYLGDDPLAVLGTQVAGPNITVTADRTKAGGLATVGWDAEGVAPAPYPLIKNGVLVDLQATRAQVATLAPYYQKIGLPVQSKGSADAAGAGTLPLTHTPNLVLAPGAGSGGLEALVAGLPTGLLFRRGMFAMDFQAGTGFGTGEVYQVKNGRLRARVRNAAVLVRSKEVWARVKALGDATSVEPVPLRSRKGEPVQEVAYTVWAVPALVSQVSVVDATRRR